LYYLQSRYYHPSVGRFINGDSAQAILSEGLGCVGYNIFAYCQNTPINGSDIYGHVFAQVFAKIILGILLGVYSQLVLDILDYLVNLISNSNAKFSAKPLNYIVSILSCILAFFDIGNRIVRILLNILPIALSYVGCTFNKTTWANIFKDLMFLIVGELIGGALNRNKAKKIEKATKKINANKKKLHKVVRESKLNTKIVNIEQKFYALGVGVAFSLDISNKIITNIASIFIK
jgi:RHS repeat-associated protein